MGATGAIERLKPYNGRVVTFDAEARTVYLGSVPIVTVERDLGIWVPLEKVEEVPYEKCELDKTFQQNHDDRKAVFVENCEGIWRRRSHTIRYFQIDYYYRAWDWLVRYLNAKFAHRNPAGWMLVPQEREIMKMRDDLPGAGLFHGLADEDAASHSNIFHFISGIEGLSVQDLRALYDARQQAFRDFAGYMEGPDRIDRYTVAGLVDELVKIFSWMHMAYWLRVCVNKLYLFDQMRHIDKNFYALFRDAAILDEPQHLKTDMSRQKDKEIWALTEQIRGSEALCALFVTAGPAQVERELRIRFPRIIERIDSWSLKYKASSEHLQVLTDTPEYIDMIRERLVRRAYPPLDIVARWYRAFRQGPAWRKTRTPRKLIPTIKARDPDLYWLLVGYTRRTLSAQEGLPPNLPATLEKVETYVKEQIEKEQEIEGWLKDFPHLKQVLALSKLETTLREDGHHYIVAHQRKIARMMLAVARDHPGIFPDPDDIFDISIDELLALFADRDCGYIKLTFDRWRKIEQAEAALRASWDADPRKASDDFAHRIGQAAKILETQCARANDPRVQRYYLAEKNRLEHRVARLRTRVASLVSSGTHSVRCCLAENGGRSPYQKVA